MGFKNFLEVHGNGLIRFGIVGGGESGEEEGWITERQDPMSSVHHQQQQNLHLPSTSPRLMLRNGTGKLPIGLHLRIDAGTFWS
jgi:hypothetical protein